MAEITWAILLIILGLVGAIVGQAVIRDTRKRKTWTWGGIGSLAFGVLAMTILSTQLAFLNAPVGFGLFAVEPGEGGGGEGIGPPPAPVKGCPPGQQIEDTTVTLSSQDKYTTVATGDTHRYRINGAPALTVSDAGTITASPGDKLSILWGNGTSSTYFGAVTNEVIPCKGTHTFSKDVVANGSITIQVFNEEGDAISTSTGEALANGEIITLEMKLKGTYQKGFPYGGLIIAEYDQGLYDDIIIDFGGSKVSTPSFYTLTGTNNKTITYTVPAVESNEIIVGSIVLNIDDENNPTVNDGNITISFVPSDYSINENNRGSFDGPAAEDEDGVQTFGHQTTFVLHVT